MKVTQHQKNNCNEPIPSFPANLLMVKLCHLCHSGLNVVKHRAKWSYEDFLLWYLTAWPSPKYGIPCPVGIGIPIGLKSNAATHEWGAYV